MIIFGLLLLALVVLGELYTNKWHKFDEPALKVWYNVFLALAGLGAISAIVAGIVR